MNSELREDWFEFRQKETADYVASLLDLEGIKVEALSADQKKYINEILAPYDPVSIAIFGSYARGEQDEDSDLDLLVSFGKRLNLFDLAELESKLTEKLGIKVDLVTQNGLSTLIRDDVEKELQMIL